MPVNVPAADREILSRYLLGQLSAPEADEVEDRFAGDDVYFALYEEVERSLVSDYAAGILEPLEAGLFEKNYLVTPERRHQVTVVRALLRVRAAELDQPARDRPIKVVGFALATSAVLATGAILILWPRQEPLNKPAVVASQHPPAAIPAPEHIPAAPPATNPHNEPAARRGTVVSSSPPASTARATRVSPSGSEITAQQEPIVAESTPPVPAPSRGATASGEHRVDPNYKLANEPEPPTNPTLNADAIAGIRSKLLGLYTLTKATEKLDGIETAGSEFVLKKNNLVMTPVGNYDSNQNTYKDGRIAQNALGGRLFFSRFSGASPTNIIGGETRTFITGEKVRVTDISVTNRAVVFTLLTQDWSNLWYKGRLSFPLPKDGEVNTDQIEKMVSEVFDVKAPENTNATNQQKPPTEPVLPRTITPGQTQDQVIATFGQPLKIVALSSGKQLYYYADKRITLVDKTVTDIDGVATKSEGRSLKPTPPAQPATKMPANQQPKPPSTPAKKKPA
jgi:anti-sigma factor RsiW